MALSYADPYATNGSLFGRTPNLANPLSALVAQQRRDRQRLSLQQQEANSQADRVVRTIPNVLSPAQINARNQFYDQRRRQQAIDALDIEDFDANALAARSQLLQGASPDQVPYTPEEQAAASGRQTTKFRTENATLMPGWEPFARYHQTQSELAAGRGNHYTGTLPGGAVVQTGGAMPSKSGAMSADIWGDNPYARLQAQNRALQSLDQGIDADAEALRGAKLGNDAKELAYWRMEQQPAPGGADYYARQREDADFQDQTDANKTLAEARTFFNPTVQAQRNVEQNFRTALAEAPARQSAMGTITAAREAGDSRVEAANAAASARSQDQAARMVQQWMKSLNDAAKSGTFGVDRSGRPLPPPADLVNAATSMFGQQIGGTNGGATGPAPTTPGARPGAQKRNPNTGEVWTWNGTGWDFAGISQ